MKQITEQLNKLGAYTEFDIQTHITDILRQQLIDGFINEVQFTALQGLVDKAYQDKQQHDAEKAALEDEIKRAVVELGVSVEGENVKATFVKGRLSWDGKGLEGYAVAHPEVMVFQKQSSPYVRLTYKNK